MDPSDDASKYEFTTVEEAQAAIQEDSKRRAAEAYKQKLIMRSQEHYFGEQLRPIEASGPSEAPTDSDSDKFTIFVEDKAYQIHRDPEKRDLGERAALERHRKLNGGAPEVGGYADRLMKSSYEHYLSGGKET